MGRMKELFAAKDLTEGPPWRRIIEFAIPMLIGNIAQQFYNTADSIIVGRYIGDNALAAVGVRVIIVIEANSYVNIRSSRLLPKFKTQKINSWCAA